MRSNTSLRNAPYGTVSTSTRSCGPCRVQWMPPNGLSIATPTARSVFVLPWGMKTPPTLSAPVSSDATTHCRT